MEKKVNIRKNKNDKLKLEKKILEGISTDIFINLIISVFVMIYFILLNLGFTNIEPTILKKDLQVFGLLFLFIGTFVIEKAYKKDSGKIAIYGIETWILSFYTLMINHFVTIYKLDFQIYALTSSYLFSSYYVLKSIIIYTVAKRKYLKNLSDISQIVKNQPVKKEAKKRNKKNEVEIKTKKATSEKNNIKKEPIKQQEKNKPIKKENEKKEKILKENVKNKIAEKEKIQKKR